MPLGQSVWGSVNSSCEKTQLDYLCAIVRVGNCNRIRTRTLGNTISSHWVQLSNLTCRPSTTGHFKCLVRHAGLVWKVNIEALHGQDIPTSISPGHNVLMRMFVRANWNAAVLASELTLRGL